MITKDFINQLNRKNKISVLTAIEQASQEPNMVIPCLLEVLEEVVIHPLGVNVEERKDYLYALFLLSEFKEKKAFPLILKLSNLPENILANLLGDCLTRNLTNFLVSTYNEEYLPDLKRVIENPLLNQWSRQAALNVLLGLICTNQLTREEVVDYIKILFHSPLSKQEYFSTALVSMASDLYPQELLPEVMHAFRENRVDLTFIKEGWIEKLLQIGKDKCLEKYLYGSRHYRPIDSAICAIWWL